LPQKCAYKNAVEYDSYNYAVTRPWDEENADGYKKGEFADNKFVDGFGLGDRAGKWHMPHRFLPPFGCEKGDSVSITIENTTEFRNAVLAIRYRTSGIKYEQGKMVGVNVTTGDTVSSFMMNNDIRLDFEPTDELKITFFEIGNISADDFIINLEALGTGGIEFDFFCICEKENADAIAFWEAQGFRKTAEESTRIAFARGI
jgi:hypothetical protein